jgi:hypothetical protein
MNKLTYDDAVNTLLDAYNTGKLQHGECRHCAVGNLLATDAWGKLFLTVFRNERYQTAKYISPEDLDNLSEKELLSLFKQKGFTQEELMKIEYAFETALPEDWAERGKYLYCKPKEGQYLGLCAVLEVMKDMVDEEIDSAGDLSRLTAIYEKHLETV